MTIEALSRENKDLRRRLAIRDAEVRDLRAALMPIPEMPLAMGLTAKQNQIVSMLLKAFPAFMEKKQIFAVLTPVEEQPSRNPTLVESHISHLRQKLSSFGISIRAERSRGYAISVDDAVRLYAMIAQEHLESATNGVGEG